MSNNTWKKKQTKTNMISWSKNEGSKSESPHVDHNQLDDHFKIISPTAYQGILAYFLCVYQGVLAYSLCVYIREY